jgi:hypothetical protein
MFAHILCESAEGFAFLFSQIMSTEIFDLGCFISSALPPMTDSNSYQPVSGSG